MTNTTSQSNNQDAFYPERLSDANSKTYKWDVYHKQKELLEAIYRESGEAESVAIADRMEMCGQDLQFKWVNGKARLAEAKFCGCRHCPVCQYRRSLKWMGRIAKALTLMGDDGKKVRFVSLTLTLKNCDVADLKKNIKHLNTSFAKLVRGKNFPATGWIKSIEVTRGKDGSAHPHIHSILAVPSDYFRKDNPEYLTYQKMVDLWRKVAKLDYDPIGINIQAIKGDLRGGTDAIRAAIVEVVKSFTYSVKPEKMVDCPAWFLEMSKQLAGSRSIAIGGMLKDYLQESDDLSVEEEEGDSAKKEAPRAVYSWSKAYKHYYRNHKKEIIVNESRIREQAEKDERRWCSRPVAKGLTPRCRVL